LIRFDSCGLGESSLRSSRCGFWNDTLQKWSSDGCSVAVSFSRTSGRYIECACSHATGNQTGQVHQIDLIHNLDFSVLLGTSKHGKRRPSTGIIVGVTIGVVILVLLAGGFLAYKFRQRRRSVTIGEKNKF
jgi:hypothetical protein